MSDSCLCLGHVWDGGYCLECGDAQQCQLCEEND